MNYLCTSLIYSTAQQAGFIKSSTTYSSQKSFVKKAHNQIYVKRKILNSHESPKDFPKVQVYDCSYRKKLRIYKASFLETKYEVI